MDTKVTSYVLTWFVVILQIDILQEENEALLDKACSYLGSVYS
jgi:hypothetical protein